MFTTTGAFNFKSLPNNTFEILNDPYNFDKSKSGGADRKEAIDKYGELTHLAQDIPQTYIFNVKGKI